MKKTRMSPGSFALAAESRAGGMEWEGLKERKVEINGGPQMSSGCSGQLVLKCRSKM